MCNIVRWHNYANIRLMNYTQATRTFFVSLVMYKNQVSHNSDEERRCTDY